MIYLLNHNTSYKHSKFSARPSLVIYCSNPLLDGHSSQKVPHFCHTKAPKSIVKRLFEYQSKPLLCWRHDLAFFNLQGFFFTILKALHTCWSFVKNNKKIVFVSTDNPTDTGHSGGLDITTMTLSREFLPRIQTGPRIQTDHDTRTVKNHGAGRKISGKTKKNSCQDKKSDKEHKVQTYQSTMSMSKQTRGDRYKPGFTFGNRCKQTNILAQLKNAINISSESQRKQRPKQQQENAVVQPSFVTDPVYHKCNGLLFRATSRRLSSSFSRLHGSFFSNAKTSFQERFTHPSLTLSTIIQDRSFENPKQEFKGRPGANGVKDHESKQLWPLNLMNACSIVYRPEKPTSYLSVQKKTRHKKMLHFGTILQQRPQAHISNMMNHGDDKGAIAKSPFGTPSSMPIKKFTYEFLQPAELSNPGSKSVPHSAFLYKFRELRNREKKRYHHAVMKTQFQKRAKNIPSHKRNKKGENNSDYKKQTAFVFRSDSKARVQNKHAKRKNASVNGSGVRFQNTTFRHPVLGLHTGNITFMRDFYKNQTNARAYERTKRIAYNPYAQNADLVFFLNPDKNPGLASQVKKLGIPSIGIVSGLKSSSYRKMPHHSNLHDSVTYPIVGNPDNLIFVMMVVRIFVRLIDQLNQSPNKPRLFYNVAPGS